MPAVGQQSHGVEPPACPYFDHHRHQRDPHHQSRAALCRLAAFVEHVFVQPVGEGVVLHLSSCVSKPHAPADLRGNLTAPWARLLHVKTLFHMRVLQTS